MIFLLDSIRYGQVNQAPAQRKKSEVRIADPLPVIVDVDDN